MITRSYDPKILEAARGEYVFSDNDEQWLGDHRNIMYVDDDGNVALATYDYPGLATVHWFFKARGREVMKVGKAMLEKFFSENDVKVLRGVTPMDNKPARFMAKRFGFQRISIEEFLDGPNELMFLPKEVFNQIKDTI